MTTRDDIMAVLDGITDPCSIAAGAPVGLVGMGLVRTLEIRRAAGGALDVAVTLTLTSPGCLMGSVFAHEIEERLGALPDIARVTVTFDHDAVWQPDDWSPAYRRQRAEYLRKLDGQLAEMSGRRLS